MNEAGTVTGARIEALRREWGSRLLILGHHYQRGNVVRHADIRGDSLELSREAARHPEAERIVFCGVRFMAETAAILCAPRQSVFMPATTAGCPMADMADAPAMEAALASLRRHDPRWRPVVYVNSNVAVKACCGRHDGSACTSGNAARVLEWALRDGGRVLFLPDEHLGRNTARDLGLPDEDVALYDPALPDGGLTPAQARAARVAVWKGFCIVHVAFTLEHIRALRASLPGVRVIVHPETPREVVAAADAHGSTAEIIRYVEAAPAGAVIAIGTEFNLVQRLAEQYAGRLTIKALRPSVCANMAKTNEENLLELLETWPESARVAVAPAPADAARRALARMLSL